MTEIFNKKEMLERRTFLRVHATNTEQILWERIRKKQIGGARFRRQTSIGGYVVDFYCPKLRLVIEIDGRSHDSESARMYDVAREDYIKQLGINILRFRNHHILDDIDGVVQKIKEYVEVPSPL
jgi:very-short-patch-repair endonuclease